MYIPKINAMEDEAAVIDFMQRFSFATIVTSVNDFPTATHLPFTITKNERGLVLTAHFAKSNPQWLDLTKNEVLVIFSEPHAYISPKNYTSPLSVPTWNYVSVHAYGKATIVGQAEERVAALEEMIKVYEPEYFVQWNQLPVDYKLKMLKGIVVFEVAVKDLQAKKKISQNKSLAERERIIKDLSDSTDTTAQQIAEYMQVDLQKKDN